MRSEWSRARPPPGLPNPVWAHESTPVLWLDYGFKYKHVEHATQLAPAALRAAFMNGGMKAAGSKGEGALLLLGLAGLFYLVTKIGKR